MAAFKHENYFEEPWNRHDVAFGKMNPRPESRSRSSEESLGGISSYKYSTFQFQRGVHIFSRLSRSQNILKDWHLLKNETPKGFKKFFEKDLRQQPKQAQGKRIERPKGLSSLRVQ